jgi:hypothetical protein
MIKDVIMRYFTLVVIYTKYCIVFLKQASPATCEAKPNA